MNFCPECDNLMSPKAINKELFYQCNICASKPQVRADKKNSMIFCKVISGGKSTEETYANKDIILDPTLPRKMDLCCPRCAAVGPVYYQPSEESMALAYVCRNTACIFSGELKDYRKVGAN